MENSIQNIILQEMEDLEGILIATTNLTANLDKAFERRFLYKIKFEKPSQEAKKQIWKAMMPELSEADARYLASKFEFSGAQIENIVRKKTIQSILYGSEPSREELLGYCCEEERGRHPKDKNWFLRMPPLAVQFVRFAAFLQHCHILANYYLTFTVRNMIIRFEKQQKPDIWQRTISTGTYG